MKLPVDFKYLTSWTLYPNGVGIGMSKFIPPKPRIYVKNPFLMYMRLHVMMHSVISQILVPFRLTVCSVVSNECSVRI